MVFAVLPGPCGHERCALSFVRPFGFRRLEPSVAAPVFDGIAVRFHFALSLDPEHLHHLVAEVVDDLDGDAAGGGLGERARGVAVEARPRFLIDLGPQRRFQRFVGVG